MKNYISSNKQKLASIPKKDFPKIYTSTFVKFHEIGFITTNQNRIKRHKKSVTQSCNWTDTIENFVQARKKMSLVKHSNDDHKFENNKLDRKNEIRKRKLFESQNVYQRKEKPYGRDKFVSNLVPSKNNSVLRERRKRSDCILINFVSDYFRRKKQHQKQEYVKNTNNQQGKKQKISLRGDVLYTIYYMNMNTEALAFKEQGNQFFKNKQYEKAIQMYSAAIEIDSTCSIFYSNRARCYKNMEDYEKSYKDAEKAVEFDDKSIKGYYLMAQSLVAIAENTKSKEKLLIAIEKLKKSLTLCPSQGKSQFQQTFIEYIYMAKKKLWQIDFEDDIIKRKKVRSYLINLVQTDSELSEEGKDTLNERVQKLLEKNLIVEKSKVPKSLVCPITKMLYNNPICNEFGHSYSKEDYVKYLKQNQHLDPITKKPVNLNIMYPNINLKKAVEHYLQKNPWAYREVFE